MVLLVRYTSVFGTTDGVKWALFAVTADFMMAAIGANIRLAYRLRPVQAGFHPSSRGLRRTGRRSTPAAGCGRDRSSA